MPEIAPFEQLVEQKTKDILTDIRSRLTREAHIAINPALFGPFLTMIVKSIATKLVEMEQTIDRLERREVK